MTSAAAAVPDADRRTAPCGRWAVAFAALVALVYVLLRNDAVHEYDCYWMLDRIHDGELGYSWHPLSLRLADAIAAPLAGWVPSLHERLRIANGLCSGVAAGLLLHAVWLREQDRGVAFAAAIGYAALPATLWFATVFELHGLFAPFAALSIWSVSFALRRRPVPLRACVGVGVVTGFAACVHGSAQALVLPLCAWVLLELRRSGSHWRSVASRLAVLVAAFAVVGRGGPALLHALWPPETVPPVGLVTNDAYTLRGMAPMVLGEWLLPYAPISVAWLAAPLRGSLRLGLAFACVLLLYLLVCQLALVSPGGDHVFHEFGAYQMPLAMFAAWIAARSLTRPWRHVLVVAAVLAGVLGCLRAARMGADRELGNVVADYVRACDDRVVLAEGPEFAGAFAACFDDPGLRGRRADLLGARRFALQASLGGATAEQLGLYLHPQVAGRHATLSEAALAELRGAGPTTAALVDTVLPELFELEPVDLPTGSGRRFRGVRLVPRPR